MKYVNRKSRVEITYNFVLYGLTYAKGSVIVLKNGPEAIITALNCGSAANQVFRTYGKDGYKYGKKPESVKPVA